MDANELNRLELDVQHEVAMARAIGPIDEAQAREHLRRAQEAAYMLGLHAPHGLVSQQTLSDRKALIAFENGRRQRLWEAGRSKPAPIQAMPAAQPIPRCYTAHRAPRHPAAFQARGLWARAQVTRPVRRASA